MEVQNPTEVREILLKAKAELSKGWTQGRLHDETGVCLYGGLVNAAGLELHLATRTSAVAGRGGGTVAYTLAEGSPVKQAVLLLAETLGIDWREMALWNDAPERTDEDVVGLIDRALERLSPVETDAIKVGVPA